MGKAIYETKDRQLIPLDDIQHINARFNEAMKDTHQTLTIIYKDGMKVTIPATEYDICINVGRHDAMGTISKNFNYHEFEASETAHALRIDNTIKSFEVRDAIKVLVDNVLQPLRDKTRKPLNISSGYRCAELNRKVGGVATSQHCKGEAADVWCATLTPYQLARVVLENGIPYDQMILYPSFLHLSYRKEGKQRMQLLYNASYRGKRFSKV